MQRRLKRRPPKKQSVRSPAIGLQHSRHTMMAMRAKQGRVVSAAPPAPGTPCPQQVVSHLTREVSSNPAIACGMPKLGRSRPSTCSIKSTTSAKESAPCATGSEAVQGNGRLRGATGNYREQRRCCHRGRSCVPVADALSAEKRQRWMWSGRQDRQFQSMDVEVQGQKRCFDKAKSPSSSLECEA